MMHWHDPWNWYWMVPTMLLGILVLGVVVYAAVRLGSRDANRR
jgi:hypothetical protein